MGCKKEMHGRCSSAAIWKINVGSNWRCKGDAKKISRRSFLNPNSFFLSFQGVVGEARAAVPLARTVLYEELVLGELLGVGNFGEVMRASWRGTDVALKIIYRKNFHDKGKKKRLSCI